MTTTKKLAPLTSAGLTLVTLDGRTLLLTGDLWPARWDDAEGAAKRLHGLFAGKVVEAEGSLLGTTERRQIESIYATPEGDVRAVVKPLAGDLSGHTIGMAIRRRKD